MPFSDCGPLSNPDNGVVQHTSGTTYGQTATYQCDTGYMMNGISTRLCAANGVWTNTPPTCEALSK